MTQKNKISTSWFGITAEELQEIIRPGRNPEIRVKIALYIIGSFFSFLFVVGAMFGFKRAYIRCLKDKNIYPTLYPLYPVTKTAMIIWGVAFPILTYFGIHVFLFILETLGGNASKSPFAFAYVIINFILCLACFVGFEKWRAGIYNELAERNRFGSARMATPEELADLMEGKSGIYLGNDIFSYSKLGHVLLNGGARGGKGVNVLVPFLLGKSNYKGSLVVIDPKGELAAISARYQKEIGQDVIVLDPWGINGASQATYNPLDIFLGESDEHLADNADLIAEMIVPISQGAKEPFFDDKARQIISGLIMHLVLTEPEESRTLAKLWQWLRYGDEQWASLLADMILSENKIVAGVGNDIKNMKETSERTYGTVMAVAQTHSDFLKSPALQKSLAHSNFKINDLSKGKTTLYVVIPADKVSSHSKWLRLVTTTALKSVVRNHDQRVTFILDEFFALGYLSEVEVGMGAYAGYNISLFPIVQNLSQVKKLYGDNWETFIGNAAAKLFLSVSDEFSMKYLSSMLGETTVITYEKTATGSTPKSTARRLFTPDEIRRGSADNIFLLLEQRPVTYFPKKPYYEMPDIKNRADDNPYITATNGNG